MKYQFEKILSDNGIAETDENLPRSITKQITSFRKLQSSLETAESDEEKEKINTELEAIDEAIMKTLPDHFDFEDEAEIERQKELSKRAIAVGLTADATETQIIKAEREKSASNQAEKDKKAKLSERAKKVGLPASASESEIEKAEKDKSEGDKEAERKKLEEEDAKPATSNEGALEKLHKKGKTSVTTAELKAAGFNTGFMGPIGPYGWDGKQYSISRQIATSDTFQLTKR